MFSRKRIELNTPDQVRHKRRAGLVVSDIHAALREAVRTRLDGAHAPKRIVVLEALPLRPSGKVDRRAVARLLAAAAEPVEPSELLRPGP